MAINPISFKSVDFEQKNLENKVTQPKTDVKESSDTVELSNKKKKPVRSFWGGIAALFTGGLLTMGSELLKMPVLSKLKNAYNVNETEKDIMHNAIKQMNVDSGLKDLGVRVRFLNPSKVVDKSTEVLSEEALKDKVTKFMEKFDRNLFDFMNTNAVREGSNAFFVHKEAKSTTLTWSECMKIYEKEGLNALQEKIKATQKTYIKANSVILPKVGLQGAGFHELGHAMNRNLSKFGKFLQKCRPIAMFGPLVIGLYGALTRTSKPKEEGKDLNGVQKTHNFVRNNAGKLAFVASLPMLIEEAMASIKGQKYAKKLLSSDLAKKVAKGNMIAYTTYLLTGLAGALAAFAAVKVKDNAIVKKERKIAEKDQETERKGKIKSLKSLDTYRSNNDGKAGGVELDKGVLDEIKKEQGYVGTYRS